MYKFLGILSILWFSTAFSLNHLSNEYYEEIARFSNQYHVTLRTSYLFYEFLQENTMLSRYDIPLMMSYFMNFREGVIKKQEALDHLLENNTLQSILDLKAGGTIYYFFTVLDILHDKKDYALFQQKYVETFFSVYAPSVGSLYRKNIFPSQMWASFVVENQDKTNQEWDLIKMYEPSLEDTLDYDSL